MTVLSLGEVLEISAGVGKCGNFSAGDGYVIGEVGDSKMGK